MWRSGLSKFALRDPPHGASEPTLKKSGIPTLLLWIFKGKIESVKVSISLAFSKSKKSSKTDSEKSPSTDSESGRSRSRSTDSVRRIVRDLFQTCI